MSLNKKRRAPLPQEIFPNLEPRKVLKPQEDKPQEDRGVPSNLTLPKALPLGEPVRTL